jgi:hypothetical protein
VVIAVIREGLGNQLFQYAAARSMALRRDEPLILDTRAHQMPGARLLRFDAYDVQYRPLGLRHWALGGLARSERTRHVRPVLSALAPRVVYDYVIDRREGYQVLPVDPRRGLLLSGFWQSARYFLDCEALIRRELTMKAAPSPRNRELIERLEGPASVSIHVRRGDYVGHPLYAQLFADGAPYYRRAIAHVLAQVPNAELFVFSDDPAWVRAQLELPAPATFIDHNAGDEHEDLRLMRHCRHHIIANSSFSWWGAWLASPGGLKIAPERWYARPERTTKDLLPEHWLRM